MYKDFSMESRNIQTQNCAPIQCTVWPRNGSRLNVYHQKQKPGEMKKAMIEQFCFSESKLIEIYPPIGIFESNVFF